MKASRPFDHLLAEYLDWPLFCAPLLRVTLKCTGWWGLYQKLEQSLHEGGPWEEWFSHIAVHVEGVEVLPSKGGYSLVANHPLGFMDGWALGVALEDHMDRVAFFAHPILAEFPSLAAHTLPMKPGSEPATKEARTSMRNAAKHLADGGILVRFESQKPTVAVSRSHQMLRAEIKPIWAKGQASQKLGTWWTWLWMPRKLKHLQGVRVRFNAGLPGVERVDQS